MLKIHSDFIPKGSQKDSIKSLTNGIKRGERDQVLLGITGSGKTFTMANVIENLQKTTLILAPNKTLASQLYYEFKEFFKDNAVSYFVSYYDYYQPEAYIPKTDTYIAKESMINERIDRMRHSATRSLLEEDKSIIVASVSCIYGIGPIENYSKMTFEIQNGGKIDYDDIIRNLIKLQYRRNEISNDRGTFRARGEVIDVYPPDSEDFGIRICLWGDEIEKITKIDTLTNKKICDLKDYKFYANSHYITPKEVLEGAIKKIKNDLKDRLEILHAMGKLVEAQRLEQKTINDIEMMLTTGSCQGIENYSRYLSGRNEGEMPPTLFEYLPKDGLLFADESHIMIPQIRAMYSGDRSRKENLVEYGFRLPSCLDNRPLKFAEWHKLKPQTIYVSATPSDWEMAESKGNIVKQEIRPTGLLDPICIVRETKDQIDDILKECYKVIKNGDRIMITVLTKKMAESLSEYLNDNGVKSVYIHSDIDTLERIEIITNVRKGDYDVIVGINLLREGIDLPECALVVILDADKAGFLRSETSLIQTMGRAARNANGRVILYADTKTNAMENAIKITTKRRKIQEEYNKKNNITPKTIKKFIYDIKEDDKDSKEKKVSKENIKNRINRLSKEMAKCAENLQFEKAIKIRNEIKKLQLNHKVDS